MTARMLFAACALALCAAPASDDPSKKLPPVPGKQLPPAAGPTKLHLTIGGGISPPNYSVMLDGDTLTYRAKAFDPAKNEVVETTRTIKPSTEQWREFWKSMDEVGLWTWQPMYRDPNIFDGTMWGVEAAHEGRAIRSGGANLYPGQDPVAKPGESRPAYSPVFEKYLTAVSKLIGDQPFR